MACSSPCSEVLVVDWLSHRVGKAKLGLAVARCPENAPLTVSNRALVEGIGQLRLVLQDDVQRVDDAGNVTEDGQQDVDQEISSAAALEENTERREDDGKDDLADIAGGERHCG